MAKSKRFKKKLSRKLFPIKPWIEITKPGIVRFAVLASFLGLWLASCGQVSMIYIWTLLGMYVGVSGSCCLNNYFDRDIDVLMQRTRNRALPQKKISPNGALLWGLLLSFGGYFILWFQVNHLSANLSLLALFIYVLAYTVGLKRRSPLALEIGGISGALPTLIGWTAINQNITLAAWGLFFIVYFWQGPHVFALSLRNKTDYKRAHIPNMAVLLEERKVLLLACIYVLALFGASLIPYYSGIAGVGYLIFAIFAGSYYFFISVRAVIKIPKNFKPLFLFSLLYIAGMILMLVLNRAC